MDQLGEVYLPLDGAFQCLVRMSYPVGTMHDLFIPLILGHDVLM